MDSKFQEVVRFFNEGRPEEGADILMNLAKFGHLDSIEQLTYIYLEQKDFESIEKLFDCARDPNNPLILCLKALKQEEEIGIDAEVYNSVTKKFDHPVLESYRIAAEAGSPRACLVLFDAYIEKQSPELAKIYLMRLAKNEDFLGSLIQATSYAELTATLKKLVDEVYSDPISKSNDVLKGLASNPACPEEILRRLAKNSDPEVRSAVAENAVTPAEILKSLGKDKSRDVRESVAGNTSTPIETLEIMAKVSYLRESIAGNTSISIALLEELSRNRNELVRREVAGNTKTPPEILKILAHDSSSEVRCYVANNWITPPEALETLATDPVYMVRDRVAGNRNTPPEILKKFTSDDNAEVRLSVAENPSAPLDLNLRISLLKRFLTEGIDSSIFDFSRRLLAMRPNTPIEIIQMLSKDESYWVRSGVAVNPSTPFEILKGLANERTVDENSLYSECVLDHLAKNPSIPTSLRKEIIEMLINDDLSPWIRRDVARNELATADVLRSLAKDKWADVRRVIAGNSVTPIEILSSLAEDDHSLVRAAVAENPRTPEDTLIKLAIRDSL